MEEQREVEEQVVVVQVLTLLLEMGFPERRTGLAAAAARVEEPTVVDRDIRVS
jgi:hypothetical protein